MTKDEALKLALEALEKCYGYRNHEWMNEAITAIKEALANVATNDTSQECVDKTSEIVHKAQRTWIGLTDEEKLSFWTADQMTKEEWDELFVAIETKLKELNT